MEFTACMLIPVSLPQFITERCHVMIQITADIDERSAILAISSAFSLPLILAGSVPKRQTTLAGSKECQTAASAAKESLALNLVHSFMSANISLEKLDNLQLREFLTANVKEGGNIPRANWLREHYVPKVYANQQVKLVSSLAGHKVAVIADETSDVAGHYVVNVLLQPLDAFHPDGCKAVLVNTEYLQTVNSVSIA